MHPLELQVKDLKQILETKDQKLKRLEASHRAVSERLDEIKEMLHPSRQKHIDSLKREVETALGG